jgi:hypothetical protein
MPFSNCVVIIEIHITYSVTPLGVNGKRYECPLKSTNKFCCFEELTSLLKSRLIVLFLTINQQNHEKINVYCVRITYENLDQCPRPGPQSCGMKPKFFMTKKEGFVKSFSILVFLMPPSSNSELGLIKNRDSN